ncbi:hypothetical protein PAPYR_13479 [Paratrimastix pyriformis]|uniref:Uncharacterized protein n=1 Tax=Paratrimastix pyriformis TaxID=342808 RepID=A0ABQ8U3N0_9EUKA|nr:hypothetical protein PAPYR_13479 [Paratrimastix pyriformis]
MIPLKYLRRLETLEELVAVLQYDLQRAQTIILTLVAQVDKMTRPRQDGSETASHFFSMPSSPENTDPSPPIVCIPIDYPYFSCINDVAGWSISSAMHYRAASSSGYSECWFSSCYSTAVITCLGAPAASQTDFHSPPARPSPSDPSPPLTSPISTPDTSSFFQQLMMQGTASTLVPTPRPHAATNDLAAPPPQISPASGAPEPEAQQPGGEEESCDEGQDDEEVTLPPVSRSVPPEFAGLATHPCPSPPSTAGMSANPRLRRFLAPLRIPSPNRSALPSVQVRVVAADLRG